MTKISSIAIFSWGLSGGAITNIVAALAKGFAELGISKLYIVYINDAPKSKVDLPETAELVKLGVKQVRWAALPLAKFLRQVQPDIFISLGFLNVPSILGRLFAGKIKTKLVISQQNSLLYQANVEHRGDWLIQSQLWLARWLYARVDGLVATTDAVLKELFTELQIKLAAVKTTVIPNMVDIERISVKAQAPSDHPWLKQKDRPVIISIGRLAKQKNFSLLIEAFNIVRRKIDARLIILGKGAEQELLISHITQLGLEDSVSLPGFATNPWKDLAKADLFALSSEEEAFGLVLVEAMACEVPIVATDAMGNGPRSILNNGDYGCLVDNYDLNGFAAALEKALVDRQWSGRLIAAGKERCQIYKPSVVAQQWLSFLQEI